jgi:rare lipoprotein A
MYCNNIEKLMAIILITTTLPVDTNAGDNLVRASWYGQAYAGHRTASGERFDPRGLTAAHPTLPLGSMVEVRRPDGRLVVVRINDRGPARGIDLSEAAARVLDMVAEGKALVVVTPLPQLAERN